MVLTNQRFRTWLPCALALASFVACVFWYQSELASKQELDALSFLAGGGDLGSVRRLSELNSAEARGRLQALAENEQAVGYCRVAAVTALGASRYSDEASFASFLRIGEPFAIRHAAASVLAQGKCKESCVSAALLALHSILQGEPALEMTLPLPPGVSEEELKKEIEPLHRESLEDYKSLLKSNPCVTWRVVRRDYASDEALLKALKSQIGDC